MKRIVILGKKGSFHQEAALKYFDDSVEIISTGSFLELSDTLETDEEVDYAVMAIENTIAGTILQNYRLLRERQFQIVGEIYLKINHHLISNQDATIDTIEKVISHPMALYQCRDFLKNIKNPKLLESNDTVSAVEYIVNGRYKNTAAIASALTANIYNLKILKSNIESDKVNFTRFFIITKKSETKIDSNANKASIYLRTDHNKGSLLKVLEKIKAEDINLSKLQSYPVPGELNKYFFHMDLEFDTINQFYSVEDKLKKVTQQFKVLGVYVNGV